MKRIPWPTLQIIFVSLISLAGQGEPKVSPEVIEIDGLVIRILQKAPSNKVSEDKNFEYYQTGPSIFRKYKNPQPRLSHYHNQSISKAPAQFWAGNIEFYGDDTAPAKPNCSEANFGLEDFKRIANDKNVKTQADFLKKIPKDALQKFTFISNSQSLQRHGVSQLRPRVMRFRTDGKFILTYTTEQNSNINDTIEAIYFDDATRRYNFIHTEFQKESDIESQTRVKTTYNPKACFACHGGTDPRPNWTQYSTWDGVIGHRDDYMDTYSKEFSDYTQMRKELSGTPELETLPWPSKDSKHYATFPYIEIAKLPNYNYRPNAHFTLISSRLNAARLARKFSEFPHFNKFRWSLLAHTIGCQNFQRDSESPNPILKAILKARANHVEKFEGNMTPFYYTSVDTNKFIYKIGTALGFHNTDWSLRFNPLPQPGFEQYVTAQWDMSDHIESVLFSDATQIDSTLAKYDVRYNLMSNNFGPNFSCMDQVADKLWLSSVNRQPICQIINENAQKEIATISDKDINDALKSHYKIWDEIPERAIKEISIRNGQHIVQKTCAQCHDGSALSLNFSNESELRKLMKISAHGYKNIIAEATKVSGNKCRMPLPVAGPCLSEQEQKSLQLYLDSLTER